MCVRCQKIIINGEAAGAAAQDDYVMRLARGNLARATAAFEAVALIHDASEKDYHRAMKVDRALLNQPDRTASYLNAAAEEFWSMARKIAQAEGD